MSRIKGVSPLQPEEPPMLPEEEEGTTPAPEPDMLPEEPDVTVPDPESEAS